MKSILLLTFLAIAITFCIAIPADKVERKDSIDVKTAEVEKTTSINAGQKTSGNVRIATKQVPEAAEKLSNGARSEVTQASKGQGTTHKDLTKQTTDVQKTVVVSQASKQTQAVKPVSEKTTINGDLNKRSESGLTSKSTSEQTTLSVGAQDTKQIEQSSDKETSSSDVQNGRFKSTSQGKTTSVENNIKKPSAGSSGQGSVSIKNAVEIQKVPQTSGSESDRSEVRTTSKRTQLVKNVAVGRPVASQVVSSQSSEENQGSLKSSEDRFDSRNSQSGERNGSRQAGQVNGGQWQVSKQGDRQKSNERSGKRSKQSSEGRHY